MIGKTYTFGRQQTRNEDVEIEYYEVLKPGATKDFVFLVGLLSHAQETGGIEEFISTRNCYFLSHRSHYGSDYHPDLSYDLMADDVLRFMDKKGLKKVTLGGLCFGARAAMRFASKYPERIEGLIVTEATVGDFQATDGLSTAAWASLNYAAHHLTLRQYKEWVNFVAEAMNYDGWKAWHLVIARKDLPLDEPVQFKCDVKGAYKGFYNDLQYLAPNWTYTGPVMVIVAANSQLTFRWELFPRVFPGFSESNVIVIPDHDHRLMYKSPQIVAKHWEQFFNALDQEDARPKL